ncbi:MAG: copper chaperone PCu(A)C [Acidimicrobiales bacterium]
MTSPRRAVVALVAAALLILSACADEDHAEHDGMAEPVVEVGDAVVALPAGAHTAAYLTITNRGDVDDRLVAVRTDAGERVELHETQSGDDGLMRMVEQDGIDVPARTTVELEPGGLHVMIFDARRMDEGKSVTLELEFAEVGTIEVEARVRPYSDTFDD